MKTTSWSKISREKADDFFRQYLAEDEKGRKDFHKWLFEELLCQVRYTSDGYRLNVGHWRASIIEKRIAKRFGKLRKKHLTK